MTAIAPAPRRTNSEALTATLDLEGKKVVDIGCGEGHLVRLMTRHGAKVFGVECNPEQLGQAHTYAPVGDEVFHDGRAEDLPFADASIDVAVFFNSLHHVDVDHMDQALGEAARVLKSGGVVYVCEPVAEGPHFELMQPAHDETDVRAAAYGAIQRADKLGLEAVEEFTYIHPAKHTDFLSFKERILRVNPDRTADFDDLEAVLQDNFERLGVPAEDGGFIFDQPMRVNVLRKA